MTRKVFIEPAWKLTASYDSWLAFPPSGYEFVLAAQRERLFKTASRFPLSFDILKLGGSIFPLVLAKSWLARYLKPPEGTALTYAHHHLVFRPEPWVVEAEYAHLLLGPSPKYLNTFHGVLEKALASPHCRKIRCWSEVGRRTFLSGLDCEKFQHKIEMVHLAVPPRSFIKGPGSEKIKILFVGSPNLKGQFYVKGGLEALETFALLRRRYANLQMVVRSDIPSNVKSRYEGMENLIILDKVVTRETMEQEYRSADIFLLPCHSTPPFTLMDAMSYELPIVTLNAWANGEYVQDGKNGLLVEPSSKVPYYYHNTPHPSFGTLGFLKALQRPDLEVVGSLVKKVSLLIENAELRKRLGQAGRREVECGKFSIATRNENLKRLFDEAIAGE